MWILKGVLLGVGLFLVGTIVYVLLTAQVGGGSGTGIIAVRVWTGQIPFFCLELVAALVIGCAMVRLCPRKA